MRLGRLCGVALMSMASSAIAQEQRTAADCAGLAANSVEAAIRNCRGEAADPWAAALLGQDPLPEPPYPSGEPFLGIRSRALDPMIPLSDPTVVDVSGEAPLLAPPTARAGPLVQIDGENWAAEQERAYSSVDGAAEPSAREGFWEAPPRLVPLTPTAEPHAQVDGQMVPTHEWLEGSFLDEPADPPQVGVPDEGRAPALPPLTEIMRSAVIDGVTVELDAVSYELLELVRRSSGVPDTETVPVVEADVLEELDEQERTAQEEQENQSGE